ncbi:MAG: DMT family transporter [Thermaerobacter sp.]|nr:DMT family transporter [Thermaerobacter sp.]
MMLIAGASYGVTTPVVKLAVAHHIPVGVVTVLQYPLPLLLFSLGARVARPDWPALRRHWPWLLLAGAASGATSLFYYQSLRLVPAALGVVLLFQFVWIAPLVSYLINRIRLPRHQGRAILVIWAGTLLAAGTMSGIGDIHALGIALGLLGGVAYAVSLVVSGRIPDQISPWHRSLVSTAAGCLMLVLLYHPWPLGVPLASALGWGTLVGIFSQSLPVLLIYLSAPYLGGALTGILAAMELPVAVSLSSQWLHEPVGLAQWAGVAAILLGVVWGSSRPREPSPSS